MNAIIVDLVVLATTENVHSDKLRRALLTEARVRSLALPEHFSIPAAWGRRYAKYAKPVPACANYRTVNLEVALISSFIDPVLRDEITGKTWSHDSLIWL